MWAEACEMKHECIPYVDHFKGFNVSSCYQMVRSEVEFTGDNAKCPRPIPHYDTLSTTIG